MVNLNLTNNPFPITKSIYIPQSLCGFYVAITIKIQFCHQMCLKIKIQYTEGLGPLDWMSCFTSGAESQKTAGRTDRDYPATC